MSQDPHNLTGTSLTTEAPDIVQVTLLTRMNFAVPNLLSAALFSRQVGHIEAAHANEAFGPFWDELLAYATACIFLCVAGLESYANELFADGEKSFPETPAPVTLLLWTGYEDKRILDKFDAALTLKGKAALQRGVEPTQSVDALIRLRNALTHFKPEWDDEQSAHHKLSARLRSHFDPSPFLSTDPGPFPRAWASHSCTQWAVTSAVSFLQDFEVRAGLAPKLATFLDRLKP